MKRILFLLVCLMSAMVHADDDIGSFSIGADWLYWKVEQQRMAIGGRGEIGENDQLKIKVLKPDFKYNNGFKIFAGYTTQDQLWNTTITLSHMPSHASIRALNIAFDGTNFGLPNGTADVDMKWNASINYLDLDIERRLVFCDDLEIVPHIGVRGQWICQKVKLKTTLANFPSMKYKNDLNGIGLEGGCWGSWNLPFGVSLIGHFGGALVYTKVHNTVRLPNPIALDQTSELDAPSYISNVWIDSFLGIAYSRSFDCFTVNFRAGWEHHLIMDTNQFSPIAGGDGNMTMQGLTVGCAVEF